MLLIDHQSGLFQLVRDIEQLPRPLTDGEARAFTLCHAGNRRLEQERIPQAALMQQLREEALLAAEKL